MKVDFIANYNKTKTARLEISDAKITFRNFRGVGDMYNQEGNRNFSVVIPDEEIAEALENDVNEYGVGWKVKRKDLGEGQVRITMPVKIKYTERSKPKVYLVSGDNRLELTEETIGMLDDIRISSVDIDIRPFDGTGIRGPHRTSYLQSIWVVQDLDRFEARMAEEEYPEE
jgi:hypothetical protein